VRRKLRLIHLWLALVLGALVVVVCVTGSVIVYEEELDHALSPAFFARETTGPEGDPGTEIALSRIVEAARGHRPDARVSHLDFRHLPDGPVIVSMKGSTTGPMEISVDPVTGQILGERSRYHFLGVVRDLHIDLLAGDTGYVVVGLSGIVILAMMGTGLYLWWPRSGRWRLVLTLKRGASPHRRNFDLHRIFGFYTFVPMLVAVVSGVILVFPGHTIDVLLREPYERRPPIRPVDPAERIDLDRVIPLARKRIPHGEVLLIHLPGDVRPLFSVSFRSFANGHPRGRSYVHVYPDTGEIRWAKATRGASVPYQVRWEWLVPTHSGDVAGHWGKVPILLAGLAPLGLMITGLLMWTRRRRVRRKRRCAPHIPVAQGCDRPAAVPEPGRVD